jgi:hypothetical protein
VLLVLYGTGFSAGTFVLLYHCRDHGSADLYNIFVLIEKYYEVIWRVNLFWEKSITQGAERREAERTYCICIYWNQIAPIVLLCRQLSQLTS